MFNSHFQHYQAQNTPIQNSYFHQFNHALSHFPHPSPISLHFQSAKSPLSPLLSPEISPQSNISSRLTSLTLNPDHYDDDPFDTQAPLLSPGNFFESFEKPVEEESPWSIEDFPPEKNPNMSSHIMKKSKKIRKESNKPKDKKEIFQVVKDEKSKTRKRNPWSSDEDAKLMDSIKIHGNKWSNIARLIEGRTGKQVRDRYLNVLMPNIKRTDWTEDEDEIISRLFAEIGPQWCKISDSLTGRTEAQVKNRYYTYLKKMSEGKIVITRPKNKKKNFQESPPKEEEENYGLYLENNDLSQGEEKKVMEKDVISFEDYINFDGETVAFLEEESIFL